MAQDIYDVMAFALDGDQNLDNWLAEAELKGRGCRERMDQLIEKQKQDESKALKK